MSEEKESYWKWFMEQVKKGNKDALTIYSFLKSVFPNDELRQKKLLFAVDEVYDIYGEIFPLYGLYKILSKYGIEDKFKEIVEKWIISARMYGE